MSSIMRQKKNALGRLLQSIDPVETEKRTMCMIISARVQDAMKDQGINKRTLAEMLNKKPSVITKWLSGTHNFTTETLVEISIALGVSMHWLHTKFSEEKSQTQKLTAPAVTPPADKDRTFRYQPEIMRGILHHLQIPANTQVPTSETNGSKTVYS